MGGHSATHPDADGGQLAPALHPDTGQALFAMGLHSKGRCSGDDRRLEAADISPQVERVAQLDDRVGDQLSGSVEGDVAAAIDAVELRADLAQAFGTGQQVGLVPAAADGVDREVLDQQQPVPDLPGPSLIRELVLQLPGGGVGDGAKPLDGEQAAVGQEQRAGIAGRLEGLVATGSCQAR